MKKNNSSRLSFRVRAFTLFLAIWILVGMIPSTALSLGTESSSDNTDVNSDPIVNSSSDSGTAAVTTAYIDTSVEVIPNEDYNESEIVTVREDESLREENVKHFDIGGGVYRAVSYSYPVHRKDSEGKWQDIDNTLTLQTADKKSSYKTADLRLEFAQAFSKNEKIFTLSENGYSLSMTLTAEDNNNNLVQRAIGSSNNNITAKSASVENHKVRSKTFLGEDVEEQIENAVKIDNKTRVKYEDVSENVDIEYIIEYNDIKENIIVNAVCDSYVYTFSLETEGLVAAMGEDGAVYLSDDETKELIYIIPAPYMYDARGEHSFDVSYTLKDEGEGEYSLTVTADKTWINSSERVFPVTIDPTVTTNTYTYDTFIDADSPNSAYGSASLLSVKTNKKIVFIHIQKPTLPSVATINSATMHVPYRFDEESGRADLAAYQVAMNWNENTLTWNMASATTNLSAPRPVRMGYYTAALSYPTFNASSNYPMTAAVNITAAAQRWYAGTDNNFGIALVRVSGTLDLVSIYTNRYNYSSYMTVDYTWNYLPDGVYAIKSVGNSGYYMNVNASSAITSGTLEKAHYTTSPTTTFTRPALFKITRVVDSNGVSRYIIRSMINNRYGVAVGTGNTVITTPIATSDASVSQSQMFTLEYNSASNGFYIKTATSNFVISASSSDTALSMMWQPSATSQALWQFVQYTGGARTGGDIYGSRINAGETGVLSPYIWSTEIGKNDIELELSYTAGIASHSYNSSTQELSLTAHDEGTVSISIYAKNAANGRTLAKTASVILQLPFEEGVYFFKNKEYNKYMNISATASDTEMKLSAFDVASRYRFSVEHVLDGYYKIVTAANNKVVSVPSSETDTNDEPLIYETDTGADTQLWRFTLTSRGSYVIRPKSGESDDASEDWCMCAGYDGSNVEQRDYIGTNNSYKDEWELTPYTITLYGVTNNNHDHISSINTIATDLIENNRNVVVRDGAVPLNTCKSDLLSTNIFISRSHGVYAYGVLNIGLATGLQLNDEEDEDAVIYFSHSFSFINSKSDYMDPNDNYSNIDVAVFIGCYTACGGEGGNNLPSAIVEYGARAAVGFKGEIVCSDANTWLTNFYSEMQSGSTLGSAVESACQKAIAGSGLTINDVVICGDDTVVLP